MGFLTDRFNTITNSFQGQLLPNGVFWRSLFSWDFWMGNSIVDFSAYSLFIIIIFVIFIVGMLVWRWRLIRLNKINNFYDSPIYQVTFLTIFFFVTVLIYAFCSLQALPTISSPFVLMGILLVTIIWLMAIIVYTLRVIPQKRRAQLEKERFLRYIPKKKERI